MKKFIKYRQSKNEFDQMIQHIANLCAIPSISIEEDSEYPFGKSVDDALEYTLKLAKEFGFKIYKDNKNRYGFVEIGNGEKILGILAHLDVVPAGDEKQWKTSAFEPVITNEKIIARGSLDDKGPAIINLYAMKYILDNNLIDKNWTIRLVFGISEETTMKSMKYYLNDFGHPYVSYTPDGEWPLIFAEKLIYQANITFPKINFLEINGGEVVNQIPDKVNCKYKNNNFEIIGISGHGSTPEKGENAIIKSILKLRNENEELRNEDLIKFVYFNLNDNKYSMENIFPNFSDFSRSLTANLGIIKTYNDNYVATFDFRIPATKEINDVTNAINRYLNKYFPNSKLEIIGTKNSMFMSPDSELVNLLMQTYNEGMGVIEKPLAIGGGTYARIVKNCVAFGSTKYMHLMHGPNEFFSFKEIKESLEIYINALIRMQDKL
ncbi:M20/M25/M40 family metallo-hydrolase [Metamycoplasma canadense]|uniref:Xaa-His dipeptidase n=1 Tax=Metamycoplasma canadense TaxID=29554 RepID=A0A077L5I8_9BACT|nr:M20/M25/M40 family metallo-hydrolase [Metamycoplasma canadense]BAP39530.1 Xaa-His dipeptidase [Metamycoplasma canadense]